jgi:hypothetical protein
LLAHPTIKPKFSLNVIGVQSADGNIPSTQAEWSVTGTDPTASRRFHRKQSGPTRPLATKNVQLVTEGEVLQLQNGPTVESADNNRDDRTHELGHARDTTAALPKILEF